MLAANFVASKFLRKTRSRKIRPQGINTDAREKDDGKKDRRVRHIFAFFRKTLLCSQQAQKAPWFNDVILGAVNDCRMRNET